MPFGLIETRCPRSASDEVALIDAVHGALIEAFRIPPGDKHIRLIEHAPHRCAVPPSLEHPELFTLVSIDCFSGRSIDAKRCLYAEITGRLESLGIPRDHVSIVLRESAPENWGIRGGQAASDVDLGFDLNV